MSTPVYGQVGDSGDVPVCPRHPDRPSYIRCQRCGRPACPECQRVAAVGVQCVDCVAETARAAPVPRTVLGGRVRAGAPVVTFALIGACVVTFLLSQVSPVVLRELVFAPVVGRVEPYRFLTTAFLHANFLHIAVNMYALWIVGPYLERMLGRSRYLALYLVSAFGGSVAVLLLASPTSPSWFTPVVGASGAVFGAFAAILVVLRRTGRDARQILALIVINVVLGFVAPGISWQAHLGGLFTGLVLGVLYSYAPRASRTTWSVVGTVLVAGVLVAAAVLKYAVS
jgi:membrane associated rhomboid family serine protease